MPKFPVLWAFEACFRDEAGDENRFLWRLFPALWRLFWVVVAVIFGCVAVSVAVKMRVQGGPEEDPRWPFASPWPHAATCEPAEAGGLRAPM